MHFLGLFWRGILQSFLFEIVGGCVFPLFSVVLASGRKFSKLASVKGGAIPINEKKPPQTHYPLNFCENFLDFEWKVCEIS